MAQPRVGHLLQGRYPAILADEDSYLQQLSRYVVLNRVRAGMTGGAVNGRGAATPY
jgi:putative transposase